MAKIEEPEENVDKLIKKQDKNELSRFVDSEKYSYTHRKKLENRGIYRIVWKAYTIKK